MRREQCLVSSIHRMVLKRSYLYLAITAHLGEKEILNLKPNLSLACCVTVGKLQLAFPHEEVI